MHMLLTRPNIALGMERPLVSSMWSPSPMLPVVHPLVTMELATLHLSAQAKVELHLGLALRHLESAASSTSLAGTAQPRITPMLSSPHTQPVLMQTLAHTRFVNKTQMSAN